MKTVVLDFETFWSTEFSLSKISFIEYIRSEQFEAISLAMKIGNEPTKVVFGEDQIHELLHSIDWSQHACVAHNGNEFDFPLLVWRYDCHPKLFVDTLCLARPFHQSMATVGGSLKRLSEHYGLAEKNNTVLLNTKGKRYIDFDLNEMRDMAQYNRGDTDNTYALFKLLREKAASPSEDMRDIVKQTVWSKKELLLSDMTARMICYPQFAVDEAVLTQTLNEAEQIKHEMLEKLIPVLNVLDVEEVRAALASAPKFANVLLELGVSPPMKTSKTTGKLTYALAKTDDEFTALLDHDDERVQMLAAARLGVKSTLLETRLAKMLTCTHLMNGRMPVPLAYHSATTGRWGGRVWNPQNLPRIPRNKDGSVVPKLSNALRMSLRAPPGYKVVVADLSGIELRVNHYLWGVQSTEELYAQDPQADLYREFAASLFHKPKEDVTKDERQLAKVAQLGLGFGAGWKTFQKVAKLMGGIELDEVEAERVTTTWRRKYDDIVMGWRKCQLMISAMDGGSEFSPDPRGLVRAEYNAVLLPSGRRLYYPGLIGTRDPDTNRIEYHYGDGRGRSKVYSGLMCENLVQAIARDVVADNALTVKHQTGYIPALTVHDELVYVVPADEAENMLEVVQQIMRKAPSWLPGIVLWSEGDIAERYGDAK